MDTTNQPPLKKERQQTDKSLTVERGKADESFEIYKGKAESETDKVVSENRLEADNARLERRSAEDAKHDNSKASLSLLKDRKSEDLAIEKERSKNDSAIDNERAENEKNLNKLVSLERESTDKNLRSERTQTDTETTNAAKLLKVEQAAHSDTRSALTTREEFLAIVSHDLRNPIGAILASSDLLLEDTAMANIGEEAKGWIDMIKRNAETSLRLINDILDMERIVEGKIKLHLAQHRLSDLIKEAVESLAHLAAKKNITVKSSLAEITDSVNCDKDRVAQILSNLLGNAVKFTPDGGVIEVALKKNDTDFTVSIADSGPGIPEEQKKRIFERFAQIGNTSRTGLGLGLYISTTLVESHQGKLWVTSAQGKGSVFSFTLPIS